MQFPTNNKIDILIGKILERKGVEKISLKPALNSKSLRLKESLAPWVQVFH
ncbi:MAG: hypothetical protein QXG76_05340 [Candidatus Bathyarchaeia archaeon]